MIRKLGVRNIGNLQGSQKGKELNNLFLKSKGF